MIRRARLLVLLMIHGGLLVVAGCTLLVTTDGLAGGVDSGAGPKGDAALVTGEGGLDLLADGGASGEGGAAVRFCDSLPRDTTLICSDFDGPTPLAGWEVQGSSLPVVDATFASSPSSSLLCTVKPLPNGQVGDSSLRFSIAPVSRLRARWSLHREPGALSTDYNMGSFYFSDGKAYVLVQLQVGPDGKIGMQEYGEPGPDGQRAYSTGPSEVVASFENKWTRITLSVDWSAPGGPGVSATVDDAPLFTDYKMAGVSRLGPITQVVHGNGITYTSGPRGETRMRIDDVAVERF